VAVPIHRLNWRPWLRRPDAISFVHPIEGSGFVMQLITKAMARFGFGAGTPGDLAAINAVVAEMTEGFNKRDAVAVSRLYTSDAEFTNVLGMRVKGAAEIEKFLASAFRTRLKAATLKTVDVTVRFIRPDVAVVHVTSQISGIANSVSVYSRRKMEFGGSERSTTLPWPRR
jgi:uncharacterized protein (TIGR02246 family)